MISKAQALQKAEAILEQATTESGILALATQQPTENYTRVWARDSIMAGYAGILTGNKVVINGLRRSLDTLAKHQSDIGIIPSNVAQGESPKVSYGGTAGRVDATLWYIIGVCLYVQSKKDDAFKDRHKSSVEKALAVANYWEFNHKHLVYTPLSGNWADEYPIHGYTLYDNCLRLWALELCAKLYDKNLSEKADQVRQTIKNNFFLSEKTSSLYHSVLYDRTFKDLGQRPYAMAGFNPSRYYDIFDCGGNGLALMLGLFDENQLTALSQYLEKVWADIGQCLTPAFWPVIGETDELWSDIKMNYAYQFKNIPHHFHNGGIWPIMMGWLSLGLHKNGKTQLAEKMANAYLKVCQKEDFAFSEYIASDTLTPGGKSPLCYSASGLIMMLQGEHN